ncbi:hypothetical protein RFI_22108 [Reticulomyxa filosa]|uniref:Uncharacterized protein n=1 Tax=Reticulomyxa filosa TaxID=46433 RepID=X6MN09_RETFI|nr:hypothetical protein RFI_22108 [Reticulomyxa filosa]|eukprot:ETO15254.1 hypothetical protein RFI_22108 [Reticulomyxa filosa]
MVDTTKREYKEKVVKNTYLGLEMIILEDLKKQSVGYFQCLMRLYMLELLNDHWVLSLCCRSNGTNLSTRQRMAILCSYMLTLMTLLAIFYAPYQEKKKAHGIGDILFGMIMSFVAAIPIALCSFVWTHSRPSHDKPFYTDTMASSKHKHHSKTANIEKHTMGQIHHVHKHKRLDFERPAAATAGASQLGDEEAIARDVHDPHDDKFLFSSEHSNDDIHDFQKKCDQLNQFTATELETELQALNLIQPTTLQQSVNYNSTPQEEIKEDKKEDVNDNNDNNDNDDDDDDDDGELVIVEDEETANISTKTVELEIDVFDKEAEHLTMSHDNETTHIEMEKKDVPSSLPPLPPLPPPPPPSLPPPPPPFAIFGDTEQAVLETKEQTVHNNKSVESQTLHVPSTEPPRYSGKRKRFEPAMK